MPNNRQSRAFTLDLAVPAAMQRVEGQQVRGGGGVAVEFIDMGEGQLRPAPRQPATPAGPSDQIR